MTLSSNQTPPFRAEHIGSLLRPAPLRQAFRRVGAGEITRDEFERVQNECIRTAVRMQEEIGFHVVTDGEFRRASYWSRFIEQMEGFALRASVMPFKDEQGNQIEFIAPYVTGMVRRTRPLALDEYNFLRSVTSATPKITLPSPSTMHFFGTMDYRAPAAYGDLERFFADLGRAFADEIAALAEAGCRLIQIDEVAIVLLTDPLIRDRVRAHGSDPDGLIDHYVKAANLAVTGRPRDVIVGLHICRGNYKGRYLGEGEIAERVFAETNADYFLLEYDTPRAGGFVPLRLVPKNKGVVLGLISSKNPELESIDALKHRVDEAAKHIDLGRLAISPQCGFASAAAGNPVTEADERAKLRLVVEAAREIWG